MAIAKKIIKKIDEKITAVREKLEERHKKKEIKYPEPFDNRRKGLGKVKVICPSCHHNKMWYKNGRYECTRCKHEIKL